jgi:hypothetical protein
LQLKYATIEWYESYFSYLLLTLTHLFRW